MKHYQASICKDQNGHYFVACVHEVGNPLITRVDKFDTPVLRMMVAPEDSMMTWNYVDPYELEARADAYYARERARIERLTSFGLA